MKINEQILVALQKRIIEYTADAINTLQKTFQMKQQIKKHPDKHKLMLEKAQHPI